MIRAIPSALAANVIRGDKMSDKKNIDNRKIIAVMCVVLAFLSVFIMLRQVKIYKEINESNTSDNSDVSVSWVDGGEAASKPQPTLRTPRCRGICMY